MIRDVADELSTLKYSHVERERRFLVDPERRPALAGRPHILIADRYLVGTRMRLRRMTAPDTGRVALKLTKKYESPDPRARPMVTTYLNEAEYALLEGLPAQLLVKRRYPIGGFAIDIFEGALAGLELAESEQGDAATLAALAVPHWAVREVTDDPAFEGGRLAAQGRMAA